MVYTAEERQEAVDFYLSKQAQNSALSSASILKALKEAKPEVFGKLHWDALKSWLPAPPQPKKKAKTEHGTALFNIPMGLWTAMFLFSAFLVGMYNSYSMEAAATFQSQMDTWITRDSHGSIRPNSMRVPRHSRATETTTCEDCNCNLDFWCAYKVRTMST
jgi:hypothetical protein